MSWVITNDKFFVRCDKRGCATPVIDKRRAKIFDERFNADEFLRSLPKAMKNLGYYLLLRWMVALCRKTIMEPNLHLVRSLTVSLRLQKQTTIWRRLLPSVNSSKQSKRHVQSWRNSRFGQRWRSKTSCTPQSFMIWHVIRAMRFFNGFEKREYEGETAKMQLPGSASYWRQTRVTSCGTIPRPGSAAPATDSIVPGHCRNSLSN